MFAAKVIGVLAAATAAIATPCDNSIPGLWRNGGSVFNLTWQGQPGAWFGVPVTQNNAWANVTATFSLPDMLTADAHFSNGHHGKGNVSDMCRTFSWDDGSSWTFAGHSPAPGKKIQVHLAMHTHDDVGWDETYQQYFDGTGPIHGRNVSKILTNVVTALKRDPARKFSYVEQAFFVKWWEMQTPAMQADVKSLVAAGQL